MRTGRRDVSCDCGHRSRRLRTCLRACGAGLRRLERLSPEDRPDWPSYPRLSAQTALAAASAATPRPPTAQLSPALLGANPNWFSCLGPAHATPKTSHTDLTTAVWIKNS